MSGEQLPFVSGERLRELLRPREAVAAIEAALQAGLDPAAAPARTVVESLCPWTSP